MKTMKAAVFHGTNDIRVEEVERPHAGLGEAVIRVTLTTICGTDLHIVRGEYPVKPGLIIGHEPVGIIEELGPGLPATKLATACSSAPSLLAANAGLVFRGTSLNVDMATDTKPLAVGGSATPSTVRRLNIF